MCRWALMAAPTAPLGEAHGRPGGVAGGWRAAEGSCGRGGLLLPPHITMHAAGMQFASTAQPQPRRSCQQPLTPPLLLALLLAAAQA